jgi:hypothetical protein
MLVPVPLSEKITKRTLFQAVVLALIAGPLCYIIFPDKHGIGDFVWCCVAMFLAPFIVDLIRPTYRRIP